MCFRIIVGIAATVMLFVSCSQYRKIELVRSGGVKVSLAIPEEDTEDEEEDIVEELRCRINTETKNNEDRTLLLNKVL